MTFHTRALARPRRRHKRSHAKIEVRLAPSARTAAYHHAAQTPDGVRERGLLPRKTCPHSSRGSSLASSSKAVRSSSVIRPRGMCSGAGGPVSFYRAVRSRMLTRGDTGRVRTSACTCGSVKNLRAAAGTAALGFPHPHCLLRHRGSGSTCDSDSEPWGRPGAGPWNGPQPRDHEWGP